METNYYKVAVEAPLPQLLTYKSETLDTAPVRGQSVEVPLGKRTTKAIVLDTTNEAGDFKLKNIAAINPERPILPNTYLKWADWLSRYYCYPLGQTLGLFFPPLKRHTNRKTKSQRSPVVPEVASTEPLKLNQEQQTCFDDIVASKGFSVHLLHGVTGSGKTEVYLNLFKHYLKEQNKKGVFLVPEISLTPQLLQRFSGRFPNQVAVLHSHLTDREKTNQWWSIFDGPKKVLLGARSALFCPLENVGLIVLDEEHENSFKQDEKLKYHARDAAIMLAKLHNCPIVLGSATPSLESWKNAREQKYHLHSMKKRVSTAQLPETEIIDLKAERSHRKEKESSLPFWLSQSLYEKLSENLEKQEQSALFLNRRGIAQTTLCQACGHTFECPNCSINLTIHNHNHLVCHYCEYTEELPSVCPECSEKEVENLGIGTELIENDLKNLFPEARIGRADRDEISSREDMEDLIEKMEQVEIDILIGTQMIAKGLDFKKLSLVGLVLADVGFNLPDFRATEKAYQLLTQMSGRAGRHAEHPGQVVIQTYNPEHPAILFSTHHSFEDFATKELDLRQTMNYPPYGRLALIKSQALALDKAELSIDFATQRARLLTENAQAYEKVLVLGPCPAPLSKVRNKYRFHTLLKFPSSSIMNHFFLQFLSDTNWIPSGAKVQIDIDPVNML